MSLKELFFALVALNDKNSYKQWFVCGEGWYFCTENNFYRYMLYEWDDDNPKGYHKATLEELIEHFKE